MTNYDQLAAQYNGTPVKYERKVQQIAKSNEDAEADRESENAIITDMAEELFAYYERSESKEEATRSVGRFWSTMAKNRDYCYLDRDSIITTFLCEQASGLHINTPAQLAYAIKRGKNLHFQPGTKGYILVLKWAGYTVHPQLVLENDILDFKIVNGQSQTTYEMVEKRDRTNLENMQGVYVAVIDDKTGRTYDHYTSIADLKKVEEHVKREQTRYKSAGTGIVGPWKDWAERQMLHPAIKRAAKWIASDPNNERQARLAATIHYDDLTDIGKLTQKDGVLVNLDDEIRKAEAPVEVKNEAKKQASKRLGIA